MINKFPNHDMIQKLKYLQIRNNPIINHMDEETITLLKNKKNPIGFSFYKDI
jgi:hypothetical protein